LLRSPSAQRRMAQVRLLVQSAIRFNKSIQSVMDIHNGLLYILPPVEKSFRSFGGDHALKNLGSLVSFMSTFAARGKGLSSHGTHLPSRIDRHRKDR